MKSMRIYVEYALLAAAPAAAFLAAHKAFTSFVSRSPHSEPIVPITRDELVARKQRLAAEYDDLRLHQPAAKAHKMRAALLALQDARVELARHDAEAARIYAAV